MPTVTDAELDAYVEAEWDNYLADLEALISINSEEDKPHATAGAPFGPGPRAALDAALAIASRMGFDTHDGEGYAGFADWAAPSGDGSNQQLGIIGHVDVVPAGPGWTFEPFAVTRKDGMLVGRGVTDDKGPLLAALYACKFWMDRGASLRHNIRFIFGCNEETGMAELPYYFKHYGTPDFLFTPDAEFPLCYGEKGLFGAIFHHDIEQHDIIELDAGVAANAVPAVAYARVRADAAALPAAEFITVTQAELGIARVEATGTAAHASTPEGARNAAAVLARYLLDTGIGNAEERTWLQFLLRFASVTDGSASNTTAHDDDFGSLTSMVGLASLKDGKGMVADDIRFPTAITGAELEATFKDIAAETGGTVEIVRNDEPFIVNPNTQTVSALMDAYCTTTGQEVKPFTMGGATYAREFPNAVSFGSADESIEKPAWLGGMHAADEGTSEFELQRALKIYIRAFGNLADVDDLTA